MAADTLKSPSITNLDASPIVQNTSGLGAVADISTIEDFVTPTTGGLVSTASIYKMVRVPTTVYVREIRLGCDQKLETGAGSASLALDVGLYYSDSAYDGTPVALQGTLISANLFVAILPFGWGTAASPDAAVVTDGVVAGPMQWTAAKRQQPLWQAAGLSSDPGGMFDIVVAVHTAANTAQSAAMRCSVDFVTP